MSYQDVLAEKENRIQLEIKQKIAQHEKWNIGYIDSTKTPITPPSHRVAKGASFRTAMTEYLPTPPDSASSIQSTDVGSPHSPSPLKEDPITVRYASPSNEGPYRQPSFRRRIGRGGRLLIDRRDMYVKPNEMLNEKAVERFSYDRDDDDEDLKIETVKVDPYDIHHMRYRAIQASLSIQTRQAPKDQSMEVESIEDKRRRLATIQRTRIDDARKS